jgi:hypothetical protein
VDETGQSQRLRGQGESHTGFHAAMLPRAAIVSRPTPRAAVGTGFSANAR